MLRGTLALMTRGLRFDCRRWQMHALRFLLVAIFLFILFISWIQYVVSISASPGLSFFSYITFTNFVFITLGGMSFFTSAITEEKEEQTLGLLKMAGVNPLGILLGKLGPRLVNTLLLLAIQFPFVQLAVTLGGVHHRQIQAAYTTLAGYIVLMAGLGILASVIARRTRRAALMVSTIIMLPLLLQLVLSIFGLGGNTDPRLVIVRDAIEWVSIWSVAERLSEVMSLGFDGAPLSQQFYIHVAGGVVLFVTSWLIFERCTRQPHTTDDSSQFSLQVRSRFRLRTLGKAVLVMLPVLLILFLVYPSARSMVTGLDPMTVPTFEAVVAVALGLAIGLPLATMIIAMARRQPQGRDIGECWSNARSLIWKDLHFVSGGAVGLLYRVIIYSLLSGLIAFIIGYLDGGSNSQGSWHWSVLGGWMLGVGLFAGTLELASNVGRGLRTEVQWQTLSTLVLLPQTVRAMIWSKLVSGIMALIPAMVMTLIGGLLLLDPLIETIIDGLDHANDGFAGYLQLLFLPMMITIVLMEIALFVELTAYFALTMRWGYVVLALVCTYFMNTMGGFAWSMFMMMISIGSIGGGSNSAFFGVMTILLPWIMAIGIALALLIAMYHAIESRIKHLASQS